MKHRTHNEYPKPVKSLNPYNMANVLGSFRAIYVRKQGKNKLVNPLFHSLPTKVEAARKIRGSIRIKIITQNDLQSVRHLAERTLIQVPER